MTVIVYNILKKGNKKRLKKAFGMNEYGLADISGKRSGRLISNILIGEELGCSQCFPHGWEVINSTYNNRQKNWKRYRKHQWR